MNIQLTIAAFTLLSLGCIEGQTEQSNTRTIQVADNVAISGTTALSANKPEGNNAKQNVEMVFCLDATGSMGGLIGTAKEKIWSIVSEMAQSKDVDTLKMGMIFYRDRGDDFVTKQIQLTTNLDDVYADLLEMGAHGGGDSPESVNQALNESINNMIWSSGGNAYQTVFVVGDCPPHMDYKDDVKYTESCKQAARKGIVINTIKLGNSCRGAVGHFRKMAECTNGEFLQLDQNATDYVIKTPYDDEINKVSKQIDSSRLYYGSKREQRLNNESKRKSMEIYEESSVTANSARASYKVSKAGEKSWMGAKEIVKDYEDGKLDLESISVEQLPEELKGKSVEAQKIRLDELVKEREQNVIKLKELSKKRAGFIKEKQQEKEEGGELSFSKEVIEIMKKQSKEK